MNNKIIIIFLVTLSFLVFIQHTNAQIASLSKFFVRSGINFHSDTLAPFQQSKSFKYNPTRTIYQYLKNVKQNSSCTEDCCKTLSPARPPMRFTFYQNTGRFRGGYGNFTIDTLAYSGQKQGFLNPDAQCVPFIGPLPASVYKITWCKNIMLETIPQPCAFYLQPQKQQEMCGRNDFFIHGCNCCTPADDTAPPQLGCSAGCIVINYSSRRKIRIGDTIVVEKYQPKVLPILQTRQDELLN